MIGLLPPTHFPLYLTEEVSSDPNRKIKCAKKKPQEQRERCDGHSFAKEEL